MGTRGVPARYGGFETAAEEIGQRLVLAGHEVTVYCRNPGQTQTEHLGMRLVNLPALRARSLETLSHTLLSILHVIRSRPDALVLFNAANAPFLPLLKAAHLPTIVHLDGLEWKRAKWTGAGVRYYRWAERFSVQRADRVIADAQGIVAHVAANYGRDSVYIPYGAPIIAPGSDLLGRLGLKPRQFHLVVARLEPENHVELIVEGYVRSSTQLPLVVIGEARYGYQYVERVRKAAGGDSRIRFLGALWDQDLLDQLYAWNASYLHGHSVGGTNPSLLRALGAGTPVSAFDVVFNREVTGGHALFFSDVAGVTSAVEAVERDQLGTESRAEMGRKHVATHYRWDAVADSYEELCFSVRGS